MSDKLGIYQLPGSFFFMKRCERCRAWVASVRRNTKRAYCVACTDAIEKEGVDIDALEMDGETMCDLATVYPATFEPNGRPVA
jgi:hypothetical protein